MNTRPRKFTRKQISARYRLRHRERINASKRVPPRPTDELVPWRCGDRMLWRIPPRSIRTEEQRKRHAEILRLRKVMRQRAYVARNREAINARNRIKSLEAYHLWRASNPTTRKIYLPEERAERKRQYNKEYRRTSPHYREYHRKWREKNKEKVAAYTLKCNSKKDMTKYRRDYAKKNRLRLREYYKDKWAHYYQTTGKVYSLKRKYGDLWECALLKNEIIKQAKELIKNGKVKQ